MDKHIAKLSRNPYSVALADRACSLFIDPESGIIFVDEGPGVGRINGAVFYPQKAPRFLQEPIITDQENCLLVLEYCNFRIILGTANNIEVGDWVEAANIALLEKGNLGKEHDLPSRIPPVIASDLLIPKKETGNRSVPTRQNPSLLRVDMVPLIARYRSSKPYAILCRLSPIIRARVEATLRGIEQNPSSLQQRFSTAAELKQLDEAGMIEILDHEIIVTVTPFLEFRTVVDDVWIILTQRVRNMSGERGTNFDDLFQHLMTWLHTMPVEKRTEIFQAPAVLRRRKLDNEVRNQIRRVSFKDPRQLAAHPETLGKQASAEASFDLLSFLDLLESNCNRAEQQCLILRYVQGYELREIALQLEISTISAYKLHDVAKRRFMAAYEKTNPVKPFVWAKSNKGGTVS